MLTPTSPLKSIRNGSSNSNKNAKYETTAFDASSTTTTYQVETRQDIHLSHVVGARDVGVAIALRQVKQQQQQQQQQQLHQQKRQVQQQVQQPSRSCWHDLGIGISLYLTCIYLPTLYHSCAFLYNSIWCPLVKSFCKRLLGGDAAWIDVVIIILVTLSLAMIRIAVIQRLVDMPSPRHVEAMVRCKSIHLLSSAYPQSLTPTRQKRIIQQQQQQQQQQRYVYVQERTETGAGAGTDTTTTSPSTLLHITTLDFAPPLPPLPPLPSLEHFNFIEDTTQIIPTTNENTADDIHTEEATSTGTSLVALLHAPLLPSNDNSTIPQPTPPQPPTSVHKSISLPIIKKSPSWVESTWESVRRSSQKALIVHENPNPRLHAAPRYATAAFRCLYSAFSLLTAWFCFSQSNIWPLALGGSGVGDTRNCWNLKGSLGVAEDFDGLDALLKFYYLLQASYHLHSGAFHILTMVLLWSRRRQRHQMERQRHDDDDSDSIKRDNQGTGGGGTMKNNSYSHPQHSHRLASTKPFTAYWRSLLQHGIALLLIGGSHLFASTRRLGAIGNFALDLSSFSLHALQLCINAPISIPSLYIKILHRGIVIPLFVYCRFYIWPFCIWRSAMFESKEWLQQMESTLFPGIYRAMMYVFTGLSIILLGLNLVLFRRLVHHPHLQRLYIK